MDRVFSYELAQPLHARPALAMLEAADALVRACPGSSVQYRGDTTGSFETPAGFLRFLHYAGSQHIDVKVCGDVSENALTAYRSRMAEIACSTRPAAPSRSLLALIGAND